MKGFSGNSPQNQRLPFDRGKTVQRRFRWRQRALDRKASAAVGTLA
jgi:hypothetical protein